jgi:hypothetical protein
VEKERQVQGLTFTYMEEFEIVSRVILK